MNFRLSTLEDTDRIVELIDQAKAFLKASGVDQWQDGYPDKNAIIGDINKGDGYLLIDNDHIVGYTCISFDGEECYKDIKGEWKSEQPYAVIHRTVIDNECKGKGLASLMFKFAEKLALSKNVFSIKVDTDEDNSIMKHILQKNGYEYCGVVWFQNSNKIAFEKILSN